MYIAIIIFKIYKCYLSVLNIKLYVKIGGNYNHLLMCIRIINNWFISFELVKDHLTCGLIWYINSYYLQYLHRSVHAVNSHVHCISLQELDE